MMNRKDTMRMLIDILSGESEKDIYMYMFDVITHNPTINEKLGNIFLERISEDLGKISDLYEKAYFIEIMIRIMADLDCCNISNNYNISDLYKQYYGILAEGYMDKERVPETLKLFSDLNIDLGSIIDDMVKILEEDMVIKILSCFHIDETGYSLKRHNELFGKIKIYKKRVKRFDIILHFYLLIEEGYVNNIDIAGEYLRKYSDYSLICADWIFSSRTPHYNYVKEGIISESEYEIFLEAGDVLEECKKINKTDDSYNGLLHDLKIISENFRDKIKSHLGNDMLKRFDKGKDFIQVACELPEE